MDDRDDFNPVEYLKEIKRSENARIRKLIISGDFSNYLLWLNQKMLNEYPEMVVQIIADDDEKEKGE